MSREQASLPGFDPCGWCARPALYLCDFPTGPGKTCDAPVCGEHRHQHGVFRVTYRSLGGRRRRGTAETIDYCPNHMPPKGDANAA